MSTSSSIFSIFPSLLFSIKILFVHISLSLPPRRTLRRSRLKKHERAGLAYFRSRDDHKTALWKDESGKRIHGGIIWGQIPFRVSEEATVEDARRTTEIFKSMFSRAFQVSIYFPSHSPQNMELFFPSFAVFWREDARRW